MSFYEIANKWDEASDEQVSLFKSFLKQKLSIQEEIRLFCRREWIKGTYIDIYIVKSGDETLYHYWIDKANNVMVDRED